MQCIGHVHDQALMYFAPQTIPSSTTTEQIRQQFASVAAEVPVSVPWILVLNCAGANPTQFAAARRINEIIRADYSDRIRGTWLMNTTPILRGVINVFLASPNEESAVTFLETDRLGLFVQLQRAGCSHTLIDWFIQKL
jgi:hypothetical protein